MINIDNYVADWKITNEDAAGRPMTVATVELSPYGSRKLDGLFAGDRLEFKMIPWIVHEIDRFDPLRWALVLRAAAATDPPTPRR